MAPPRRTAAARTVQAVAEDLGQVRRVGGLWRADESNLLAAIDLIEQSGLSKQAEPIERARDLLISVIRRICAHETATGDNAVIAAASSLETLMLRRTSDTRLARVVREAAARSTGHAVTADAIRHREDLLLALIAADAFDELQRNRSDRPQTLEAAIHELLPIVSDIRQQLHDGLCLIYMDASPADPREQRVIEGFYRQMCLKFGDLLLASFRVAELGVQERHRSSDDVWFVARARNIVAFVFEEGDDRKFMREFAVSDQAETWEDSVEQLLAQDGGRVVFDRWVSWVRSCYPTCAFERTTEILKMCSPHALLTMLYDIELRYLEAGFSDLNIAGNEPIRHHRIN